MKTEDILLLVLFGVPTITYCVVWVIKALRGEDL